MAAYFTQKRYSRSETGRALMKADEIKRLGDRELVIASGHPPVLTDKARYYENNYFRKRLVDAPAASDLIRNNPYPERDALLEAAAKEKQKEKFTFEYNERL